MKKSRMNFLKRAYKCAQKAGTFRVGYCICRKEFLNDRFNYEFLQQKGYIKIIKKDSQFVICITANGAEEVEDTAGSMALAIELSKLSEEKMMKT